MNIKEIIKDNWVYFDSYRQGFFYYNIPVLELVEGENILSNYQFFRTFGGYRDSNAIKGRQSHLLYEMD